MVGAFPPKVSIIVATLNNEQTIDECLKAIFELDYPKDSMEIIVVDGCSKDVRVGQAFFWQSGRVGWLVAGRVFEMCGRYRVSLFNYSPEELEAEMQSDLEAIVMTRSSPPGTKMI